MASLGRLVVTVAANIAEFTASMDKAALLASKRSNDISKAIDTTLKVVGRTAAVVGALVTNEIRKSLNIAEDIKNFSQSVGMGVEEFQKLGYAAQQNGVNIDEFRSAMSKFANTITDDSDALKAMGISTKDAAGNIRPTADILMEVADKFALYKDSAEKTALAQDLFGKSGSMLIPTLNEGANGLKNLGEQATIAGQVMSTSTVNAAAALSNRIDAMKGSFRGVINQLMEGMLPALTDIGRGLAYTTGQSSIWSEVGAAMGVIAKGLASTLVALAKSAFAVGIALFSVGKAAIRTAKGDFSGAWDALVDGKNRALGQLTEGIAQIEIIWGKGAAAAADKQKEIAEAAAKAQALLDATNNAPVVSKKKETKTNDKEEERLKKLSSLLDEVSQRYREATMSADEMLIQDAERLGATAAQVDELNNLIIAINQANAAKESAQLIDEMSKKTLEEQKALYDSFPGLYYETASAAEKYAADLQKLIDLKQQLILAGRSAIEVEQWFANASKQLAETYRNETTPAVQEFAQAIGTAFEDAILSGKSLSNVLRALAEDILRILIRVNVTKPLEQAIIGAMGGGGLGGLFGNLFGGLFKGAAGAATGGAAAAAATGSSVPWVSSFSAGKRALGGDVMAGRSYLVGEQGPELFVAKAAGHILSNAELLDFVIRQPAKEVSKALGKLAALPVMKPQVERKEPTLPKAIERTVTEPKVKVPRVTDLIGTALFPSKPESAPKEKPKPLLSEAVRIANVSELRPSAPLEQRVRIANTAELLPREASSEMVKIANLADLRPPRSPEQLVRIANISDVIGRQPAELSARVTALLSQLGARIEEARQPMSQPSAPPSVPEPARSYRQVFNISTPNADSFRLSQRQIARRARGFVTA